MRVALIALLFACGSKSAPPASQPAPANDCVKTGCSGTVCAEPGKEVVTTCEYKAEYACYEKAACERQADHSCGWTQSPELASCLQHPPQQK